jgi:SAM-dependent methyltransferase
MTVTTAEFAAAYAQHRAAEGRTYTGTALRALPYLRSGPHAAQWKVRARSFEAFIRHVVNPFGTVPLRILDLGAGNGWLSHRLACMRHNAIALDIRDDTVDGLGAAAELQTDVAGAFGRVASSFDELPFESGRFDVAVFNASLHYARDLGRALSEAGRVTRTGGILAILDSPFYARDGDGQAMVDEKRAQGTQTFGASAGVLLSQNFVEYLTRRRLAAASPGLAWSRHRVLYPLWYELRPLLAHLRSKRAPSRFDLWTARVP